MKLNGWTRVWVVFSVIWITAVSVVFVSNHRSEVHRYSDWANELLEYLINNSPELQGNTLASIRAAYSDMSDKQLVEALHEKYLDKHPAYSYGFTEIDARYKLSESDNPKRSFFFFLIVLGAPCAIYILGVSIAWVRAGFEH